MTLVCTDEAIEDLKRLWAFDIRFMPVLSLFSGYGMALKVNDSNFTKRVGVVLQE